MRTECGTAGDEEEEGVKAEKTQKTAGEEEEEEVKADKMEKTTTVNSRIKSTSWSQRGRRSAPTRTPKTNEHGPTTSNTYKTWDLGGVFLSAIIQRLK